jgi:hypothetical protein
MSYRITAESYAISSQLAEEMSCRLSVGRAACGDAIGPSLVDSSSEVFVDDFTIGKCLLCAMVC